MQERIVIVMTTLLLSRAAVAHPGHGAGEGTDAAHFLTEPVHFVPLVLVAAVDLLGWRSRRRRARR